MPLRRVKYACVLPNPKYSVEDFRASYYWLERELGYYPFFLAACEDTQTIYTMTGFNACFKTRTTGYDSKRKKLVNCRARDKGPQSVLFRYSRNSFEQLHHQDYDAWHMVLNHRGELLQQTPKDSRRLRLVKRILLKPSWTDEDWHHKSRTNCHSVQATVPMLDLRKAEAVYCTTQKSKTYLEQLGFQNVILYRAKSYEEPRPFR